MTVFFQGVKGWILAKSGSRKMRLAIVSFFWLVYPSISALYLPTEMSFHNFTNFTYQHKWANPHLDFTHSWGNSLLEVVLFFGQFVSKFVQHLISTSNFVFDGLENSVYSIDISSCQRVTSRHSNHRSTIPINRREIASISRLVAENKRYD